MHTPELGELSKHSPKVRKVYISHRSLEWHTYLFLLLVYYT